MNEKSMIKCNTKLKLELICYPASSPSNSPTLPLISPCPRRPRSLARAWSQQPAAKTAASAAATGISGEDHELARLAAAAARDPLAGMDGQIR